MISNVPKIALPPIKLILLCMLFIPHFTFGQCDPPQGINFVNVTHASCPTNGKIEISDIWPSVASPSKRQFALYSSTGSEVKPWQDDSTFLNVTAGTYTIRVRTSCPTGVSSNYESQVTVQNTYEPIDYYDAYPSPAINCCNGSIYADAYTSSWNMAPFYSLVKSLNADDLDPASFVRPKQENPQFDTLCAGTYYIRVYDACGTFQTISKTITLQTKTPSLSTTQLSRTSCDSLEMYVGFLDTPPYRALNTVEKSWIEWPDNSLDTISLTIVNNTYPYSRFKLPAHKLSATYDPSKPFIESITWPVNLKIYYKDACNVTHSFDKTFNNPGNFQYLLDTYDNTRCDSVSYAIAFGYGPRDATGIPYSGSEATISLDNGVTWQNMNEVPGRFKFDLQRGQTYPIKFAVCKDTISTTITVPQLPGLYPLYNTRNTTSCDGDLYVFNQGTTNKLYAEIISGPAGVTNFPSGVGVNNGTAVMFPDLPFGQYTYIMKDTIDGTCVREVQNTATISQRPFEVKMQGLNNGACKDRINLQFWPGGNNTSYVTEGRPVLVQVLSQPAGAGIPSTFMVNGWTDNVFVPEELRNVIAGDYSFRLVDSIGTDCPRSTTASITVAPEDLLNLDFNYQVTCNGDVSFTSKGSNVIINMDGSVSRSPFYGMWSIRLIDSTGTVRNFTTTGSSSLVDMSTTRILHSVPAGTYTVQAYATGSDSCRIAEKTLYLGFGQLSVPNARMLAGCGSAPGSGTMVAPASGGSGVYSYSLYQGQVSDGNRVAGPQASPIFNGLNSNNTYTVFVTDECGSGTQRTNSTAESTYPVGTSANKYCPGDNMTLSVSQIPGASYQWKKDGNILPDETSYKLTRTNVQASADNGAYTSDIIVNNCTLASNTVNIIVDCTTLPVTLTRFEAKLQENHVALQWETTAESNFSGFSLERSLDAKLWTAIKFVPAKVSGDDQLTTRTYSAFDFQILNEVQYYRLKNVDLDGSYAYSQIRSVKLKGLDVEISAYPNPADQILTIDKLLPETVINLVNSSGKTVYQSSTMLGKDGKFIMDVSRLPAGVYLLTIKDKSGNQIVKR